MVRWGYQMKLLQIVAIVWLWPQLSLALTTESCPNYQVCFTPGQSCTHTLVNSLKQAKQSIAVQAYSFTSFKIAKALVQAKQRGVEVRVILDKTWLDDKKQDSRSRAAILYMYKHEVPLWVDYEPSIAHNKVMIIDGKQVITGSFNFTNSAEKRNAENVLIIDSPVLAEQYLQNWQKRFAISLQVPAYAKRDSAEFEQFKRRALVNTHN